MCITIVCFLGCDVLDFEINLSNQAIFYMTKKDKNLNILRTKKDEKHFSSFLKGFQLLKIVSDLRVRLNYSQKSVY